MQVDLVLGSRRVGSSKQARGVLIHEECYHGIIRNTSLFLLPQLVLTIHLHKLMDCRENQEV
jgi:hypothetical protein